jgi:hypothetical protein
VISFASASAAGAAGYALTVLLTLTGLAAGACGLYLVGLALASFFARPTRGGEPRLAHQLAVLVPAHNEAALIARCLESLAGQDYPTDRYTVVVIADNCTDDTAAIAVACGVRVLTRESTARGKGQALQWAMEQLLNEADAPEAMVVIDADSVVDRGLLGGLTAELDRGAEVVQAEYLALTEDDSLRATLRASSLLLFHRVRFSGRKVLGLPCSLVGNGMLFSRQLRRSPGPRTPAPRTWSSPSTSGWPDSDRSTPRAPWCVARFPPVGGLPASSSSAGRGADST